MTDQAAAPHADPERAFDGQYQLGSEIGAGALGVVYRGVDEKLDKHVAIKVWHARFEDGTPQREQYDAEARALTALEHPNLIAITDYGIAGKAPYLVMELLEGERLDARMRAGAFTSARAQGVMQSVLRGLGYMHMRGVVHRNLKPDNIFLQKGEAGETLKLLDLGLESLTANDNAVAGAAAPREPASIYDPPEREQGMDPDGRADVYAAGLLMLHLLSGQEPSRDVLRAAGQPDPEALSSVLPSANPEVKAFIAKAVATERGARFGNADQMLRALLELPTPWLIGEVEEAAAPAVASSARPMSQPAHADFGASDTVALPAAEGGESHAEAASADDDELEPKPIGLVARLRVHKKLWMIAGGVLTLGVLGTGVALYLSARAEAEKVEALAAAEKKAAAKSKKKAAAKAPAPEVEHAYHAEEAEEIEEGDEAAVKGAAGQAAAQLTAAGAAKPGAEPANAALAAGKQPGAIPAGAAANSGSAAPGANKADPTQGEKLPAHGEAAARGEKSGAAAEGASAHGEATRGEKSGAAPAHGEAARGEKSGAAAEETSAHGEATRGNKSGAAPTHGEAARGEKSGAAAEEASAHGEETRGEKSGTAAAHGEAAPGEKSGAAPTAFPSPAHGEPANQHAAAASGEANAKAAESGAAKPGEAAALQPTAAPEQTEKPSPPKKPPTPQELGSERHIEPDQAEIRHMLALALKSSPRIAAADPWAIAVPDSLQALRNAIAKGERGTAGNIKTLRKYNAANPEDVYGHLLLAGFYANRGYALDALDQYDLAYRIDSSSRGAPEMLKHALNMVAQGIASGEAERFINRVYGREAQAQLTQQLRARTTTPAAATRLRQLSARLGKRR